MAEQKMSTQAARIGALKGEILAHAIPVEVLGITGTQKPIPKNSSDTVKFRRWLPYGATNTNADSQNRMVTGSNVGTYASSHITSEGVTPTADSLTAVDVSATLQQYACLYGLTDKVNDLYEDNVADEMKRQTGERVGMIREMVRYGALKGMTNAFFAGGTSKSTVSESVSKKLLRKVTRSLKVNHGKMVTSILAPSANFNTSPVEASYIVFAHTDLEDVIRDLTGFKHVSEYGQRKVLSPHEIGSVESFRFVLSPELAPEINAGAAVASAAGMLSTGGTKIDIYPMIVVAQDAWGQVALRGENALDPTYIAPGVKTKSDPLGQRGYIGAKFYMVAKVLNDGWGALVWAGASDLE